MATDIYPGKGLSLPQLTFALNEELRRVAYSPLFTLATISQLERDVSAALSAVREWKNSFVGINRIPFDILSLIPTYLTSQKDRFRATFVCRCWRKAFLQHGALWSKLYLRDSEHYVKTLLGRSKGSLLDVVIYPGVPLDTIQLLSPHARRIGSLKFVRSSCAEVLQSYEVNPGPFPLLRTLEIITSPTLDTPRDPPLSFHESAPNLERLIFHSDMVPPLGGFAFPSLTTCEILLYPTGGVDASHLLNFLKASPTLQKVEITINTGVHLGHLSPGTVAVLPNVEIFALSVTDAVHFYDFAAHILCPRVTHTQLTHGMRDDNVTHGTVMFPSPSSSWSAIVHQYTRSPVEEVTLDTRLDLPSFHIAYSLTFRSSDTSVLSLRFQVSDTRGGEDHLGMNIRQMDREAFSQACGTIRNHPLQSYIKRLHATGSYPRFDDQLSIAEAAEGLFGSLGPLDELTINGGEIDAYLAPYFDPPRFEGVRRAFPLIKRLTISYPWQTLDDGAWMDAVMELAKSQHELGIPFERVTILANGLHMRMAERLRQWVGMADCSELSYGLMTCGWHSNLFLY